MQDGAYVICYQAAEEILPVFLTMQYNVSTFIDGIYRKRQKRKLSTLIIAIALQD
jgi:hypothetical protein